jgi:NhaA family Na+:H+ antiporter
MTHQGYSNRLSIALSGRGNPTAARVVDFIADRYLLLPLGAAIAFVWANTLPVSYFRMSLSLSFLVNEILMAFFFALVAQEIVEAVMPGGALHTWRRWIVPVIAAAGGALGAALVYLAWVGLYDEPVLAQAWPVACAVDLVAGYYVLKAIFRRSSAIPFLLVIGILTNGVMLMIVSLRYDYLTVKPGAGGLLVAAIAMALLFRYLKVRAFWPYFAACGTLSWFAFYWSGVHPALSLVPIVPFLPHEPRRLDLLEDNPPERPDEIRQGEHEWTYAVQAIVFVFGLVNAGVILQGYDTGTWAVMAAALAGRPAGILLAMAVVVGVGLHLPLQLRWRDLVVAAMATSSGFTMALFVAVAVIPIGPLLAQLKLGALFTVAGALITLGIARALHVGRYAARRHGRPARPEHVHRPSHAHA